MRRTILWHAVTGLVLSGLVTLSSGCRKELCYNHDEHAYSVKVDVTATWEREWERDHGRGWKNTWEGRGWNNWMTYDDLRPEVPGGIRAVVYDPDGNRHDERNLAAEGGRLAMTEGRHSILFYNNNTEYIVFNDLTSSATATATTRTRTRAGFSELHKDERTVGQPDMLYGSYLGEYEAKPGYEAVSCPWNCARWSTPTWYVVSSATEPNTWRWPAEHWRVWPRASTCRTGTRAAGQPTVFFDATVCDWGSWAQVRSFGIPDWPGDGYTRATDRNYTLQLEVRLKNGKYLPAVHGGHHRTGESAATRRSDRHHGAGSVRRRR